jgi:hypothetical protein
MQEKCIKMRGRGDGLWLREDYWPSKLDREGPRLPSKWERRKQQASDDSQDASSDRQTRSTAFSVSASSVFLLVLATWYIRSEKSTLRSDLPRGKWE